MKNILANVNLAILIPRKKGFLAKASKTRVGKIWQVLKLKTFARKWPYVKLYAKCYETFSRLFKYHLYEKIY